MHSLGAIGRLNWSFDDPVDMCTKNAHKQPIEMLYVDAGFEVRPFAKNIVIICYCPSKYPYNCDTEKMKMVHSCLWSTFRCEVLLRLPALVKV